MARGASPVREGWGPARPGPRLARVDFRTTVEQAGKTATGLPVPDEVVTALGGGRRPAVRVVVGRHTYRSTVAPMGGRFLVPLSAANRTAAGVEAGQEVDVRIELDEAPREVEVPADLAAAMAAEPAVSAFFERLAPSHRKEWVRWVTEAKKAETRSTRITKAVELLRAGQRTH